MYVYIYIFQLFVFIPFPCVPSSFSSVSICLHHPHFVALSHIYIHMYFLTPCVSHSELCVRLDVCMYVCMCPTPTTCVTSFVMYPPTPCLSPISKCPTPLPPCVYLTFAYILTPCVIQLCMSPIPFGIYLISVSPTPCISSFVYYPTPCTCIVHYIPLCLFPLLDYPTPCHESPTSIYIYDTSPTLFVSHPCISHPYISHTV